MDVFDLFAKIKLDSSELDEGLGKSEGLLSKFADGVGTAFSTTAKVAGAALAAASTAAAGLAKAAVESYSEYEQLVGGVETLFGAQGKSLEEYAQSVGKTTEEVQEEYDGLIAAQEAVMNNASQAYKSAGLSANDYMDQVIKVSAALKQSYDSNEEAAAAADLAIIDMADNANKMGTSLEGIQNAYAGFAKQNYTMLDNLSLGYGGTKEEMERLLKDAEKFSGVKYDINNLGDVYSAIHVIQTELGITGTTAEEAAQTIQGSMGMLSGAWDNFITSLASGENIDETFQAVADSAMTVFDNILPVVETALVSIAGAVEKLAPKIAEVLPGLVSQILPAVITAGTAIMNGLVAALPTILQALVKSLPLVVQALIGVVPLLISALTSSLGLLIDAGVEIVIALAEGLVDALPELIPAITEAMIQIVMALTDPATLSLLVDAAIQLMIALSEGIIAALPQLIEAAPVILMNLVTALVENAPLIIEAAAQILTMFGEAFVNLYNTYLAPGIENIKSFLIEKVQEIVSNFISFFEGIPQWISELPEKLAYGLGLAVGALLQWVIDMYTAAQQIGPEVIDKVVEFFTNLPENLAEGLASVITTIATWITNIGTKIAEEVPKVISSFLEFFTSLPEKMLEIGGQIVEGLWEGIQNSWDDFVSNVTGIVGSFIDGVKEKLGIASPSKVFKEIGKFTAEGFGAGWDDTFSDVKEGILNDLDFSATALPALSLSADGEDELGAGNIYQTINVNQQIATPDELAQAIRLESRYGLMRGVALG